MKKIKFFVVMAFIFALTGCLESDTMENIHIRTTAYPIQYVVERLYGEHSVIESIYPNGSTQDEKVSDKLLKDYSKDNLFVFVGLNEKEQDYFLKMREYNKKLNIINASSSISNTSISESNIESIWLDPMNLLTMANDIKKRLSEYIKSTYLINDIEENYLLLKQDLIQLDADYRDMAERATRKTIVVDDDGFLYLTKYGLTVISLEENENLTDKNIYTVKEMIKNGEIAYIYRSSDKKNETIDEIEEETEVKIITLSNLYTRSEDAYNQDLDYLNIMKNNLELLKEELYR